MVGHHAGIAAAVGKVAGGRPEVKQMESPAIARGEMPAATELPATSWEPEGSPGAHTAKEFAARNISPRW